jgi:hypothetical protein
MTAAGGKPWERFLPPELPAGRVAACLGLVSDTHLPERCRALPPALFDAFRGVDLLLHAGDVGALSVLDRLGAIAPMVAVHGNDDTAEARRELPYQQIVKAAGRRLLLTHAHYPDRADELASRRDDAWEPKLARRAAMGRRAGAPLVVFGHTHVPMAFRYADDISLINPGALAAPNAVSRQSVRSVALLFVPDDAGAGAFVSHVRVDGDEPRPFVARVRWEDGFRAAHDAVTASILAPDLAARWESVRALGRELAPDAWHAAWMRAAHRCWDGERETVTTDALRAELRAEPGLPVSDRTRLEAALLA